MSAQDYREQMSVIEWHLIGADGTICGLSVGRRVGVVESPEDASCATCLRLVQSCDPEPDEIDSAKAVDIARLYQQAQNSELNLTPADVLHMARSLGYAPATIEDMAHEL